MTTAQLQVFQYAQQNYPKAVTAPIQSSIKATDSLTPAASAEVSTPKRPSGPGFLNRLIGDYEATPRSSPAGSPAPEDISTPQPGRDATPSGVTGPQPDTEVQDRTVPIMPLDLAILASISEGARGDDRKMRDFLGGIMVIGGGSKTFNFNVYLEQRLRALRPNYTKEILIGPPPRELDPQVLVWKGGSVFGKLRGTNDSWIGQLEYDRLGARILNYKCMWAW